MYIVLGLITFNSFGQKAVKQLRAGNSLYEKGNYKAAEISYRKSLEQQNDYNKAKFNLGDAMYKQQKYDEATKIFQDLTSSELPKNMSAQAYHNLGNSLLQQKKYQESIEAYKNALKQKPNDIDTKYNLEYAKKKIMQQQDSNKIRISKNKINRSKSKNRSNKNKNRNNKTRFQNKMLNVC